MSWQSVPCKPWHMSLNAKGYGILRYRGSMRTAHRAFYEIEWGPIPVGWEVHHRCNNRSCVEIRHLEACPHRDNIRYKQGWTKEYGKWFCKEHHLIEGYNKMIKAGSNTIRCRKCFMTRAAERKLAGGL